MKILIMPSWYPNKANPLWGNYFIKQAEALNEYAEISFLNINRVGLKEIKELFSMKKTDGYYDKKYSFKFVSKSILNLKAINLKWSYKKYQKASYKAYKLLEKNVGRPDVILVESVLPAGLGALYISRKEKIPYVIHEHTYDTLVNDMYREYSELVIKNASYCMAVQDRIQSKIKEIGNKCDIIPNYIDTKRFNIKKKKQKVFTMLNICNFYKVKALEILLQALSKVVYEEKITDIKLNIVGMGDYKSYYENISNELELNDYVNFLGYVNNNNIPDIIASSDTLCVSSRVETFCIPIIESFSCGVPVITTKCGGPDILVNDDRGIKVEVDNVEEYKKAIIEMKKNHNNYDSNKLKEYAYQFDKEVVCNKIIDICKKVI